MPAPITLIDEKPAARTNHGGLDFARTTTRLIHGKDNRHGGVQHPVAPIKAHR